VYLSGYLHRDLSLGNVLLASSEKEKFQIPDEFREHLSSLEDKGAVEEIWNHCRSIEELVGKLDIPHKSCAVIGDGDLAVPWKDYLIAGRRASKSVSDFRVT
jgi:hypothetical protein